MEELLRAVERALPGVALRRDEPMARHTTFRIGGPIAGMLFPRSEAELAEAFARLRTLGVKPLLVGRGSNLLVTDAPLKCIAVKTCPDVAEVRLTGDTTLRAACGTPLAALASFALAEGLTGLEFAHGIPGSLGGAVYMNAGAYGGEMKNAVRNVSAMTSDGVLREYSGGALEFSYRHSVFTGTDTLILAAELTLARGERGEIEQTMRDYAARRAKSQPLAYPSAGSAFKRPPGGYAAAMIDEAGLRGYAVGGAQVSERHAGFIVNRGGATFEDVTRLLAHVREVVYARTGVTLEPEIKIIKSGEDA